MTARQSNKGTVWLRTIGLTAAMFVIGGAAERTPFVSGTSQIAVGEYLIAIGGCNDCHTVGWNQNPGKIPLAQRLTGNPVGWHGPWGTLYAVNLRLFVQGMTADAWLHHIAGMQPKPPMPWFNMRSMSEADLRAIYAYISSLGPGGEATPVDLAPGEIPTTPYIQAVPTQPGSKP